MAPAIVTSLAGAVQSGPVGSSDGPLVEAIRLLTRDKSDNHDDKPKVDPSAGVLDPHDISNVGFFVLFALIGVAFVVTGIWFFFWAKNGGFHFRQNDWEDYKTTVLRRKGPNGTILSGATPTTDLGGGSVYKDIDEDNTTVVTESTGLSGVTAGASDIAAREKRRHKQEKRDRDRESKRKTKKKNRHIGNDGVEDEVAEKEAKTHLRSYRHEKPARVGGLNKESDASTWDGSTNTHTESGAGSDLLSNRQSTPTSTPTGTPTKGGIRKVYSTADRNADRETERLRAEARRLREVGRTSRRDFSYQRAVTGGESNASESLLEGSAAGSSDVGTKSYHHPMPELREQREREREERRARRGGYRRGRGDEEI